MDTTQGVLNDGLSSNGRVTRPARRQRLLFLISQLDTGGVQFQLYLRLQQLDRSAFDCHVGVLTDGQSYLVDKIRNIGVPVTFLHIDREPGLWRRVTLIQRFIQDTRPDIVDSLLGWDNTYGNIAATLCRVPLIVAELQNERTAIRRTYPLSFRLLEALALRFFCDRIVCCSVGVLRSYARLFPGFTRKATVIHDAIDGTITCVPGTPAERTAAVGAPAGPIIGTIGRLMEQKDHETLVHAARRVCDQHPNAQFLIGGYGPLRRHLESLVTRLGLQANVRLVGEVLEPTSFYGLVDLFVMTSRWEGFPVVLLEAMACGKPVVSTTVGGIAEMIQHGHNGLLCPAGNSNAVARALTELLDRPDYAAALGRRAAEEIRGTFAIQRLVARWSELYHSVRTSSGEVDVQPESPARLQALMTQSHAWTQASACEARPVRILVQRLCPMPQTLDLLAGLAARHPGARIDCLCQTEVQALLAEARPEVGLEPYGSGPFTLAKLGLRRLYRLRARAYDLVVVPYNTAARAGYAQPEIASLVIGNGRVETVNAWTNPVVPAGALTWKSLLERRLRGAASRPVQWSRTLHLLARGVRVGSRRQLAWRYGPGGSA